MKEVFKKELFVGITVSILFTFFIQPIFLFLWGQLVKFSFTVSSHWLDSVYAMASLGDNNRIQVVFLLLFLSILYFLIYMFADNYRPSKIIKPLLSQETEKEIDPELLTLEQREEKVKELKTQLVHIEKTYAKRTRTYKISYSVIIIIFTYISLVLTSWGAKEFAVLQVNTSLNQRLTVLAAVITDQEYKDIKGSWASMKSRQDYENIENNMNTLASQYKIELPEPLLP